MTDRPIIFSAPMVRAIMDGRKTQTRRIINPGADIATRYAPGDRLWVREAIIGARGYDDVPPSRWGNKPIWYSADGDPDRNVWWHLSDRKRPSIHMPRWASRLTLTVTNVRVQRLQEISEDDAIAEGANAAEIRMYPELGTARHWFRDLWDSLNAKRGFGWDTNPWVAAISFEVRKGNIDAP